MLQSIDRKAIIDNIYGGSAQLVPCLYGLPSLTGDVTPNQDYQQNSDLNKSTKFKTGLANSDQKTL